MKTFIPVLNIFLTCLSGLFWADASVLAGSFRATKNVKNIRIERPEATARSVIELRRMSITNLAINRHYGARGSSDNSPFSNYFSPEQSKSVIVEKFCKNLAERFQKYHWDADPCGKIHWQHDFLSQNGSPLIYARFGRGTQTTLLLSGVHPDELTPISLAFKFTKYLAEQVGERSDMQVIIAPLVNPDGFFMKQPTRTNSSKVDLNRNFYTADWYNDALPFWRHHKDSQARYFPGYFPNSEIETIFQIKLIDDFQPAKILSLHAPLGFLDYDGPSQVETMSEGNVEQQARKLVEVVAKSSGNFRVVDFNYYPGSLGNYAGRERRIPTLTLEMQTTNPQSLVAIWQQFLPGIKKTVFYPLLGIKTENQSLSPLFHLQRLN